MTTITTLSMGNDALLKVGDIMQINFNDQVTVSRVISIVREDGWMDLELVEERYDW